MKDQCLQELRHLTKHDHVALTNRGNASILLSLILSSKDTVLIPSEGGWMTYEPIALSLNKKVIRIKTTNAVIDLTDLKKHANKNAVLLYHSVGGYFAPQDIKQIYDICKSKDTLIIMDACGSLGTEYCNGNYADIIFSSFGKWKPVDLQTGGFISFDTKELKQRAKSLLTATKFEGDTNHLFKKLKLIKDRLDMLKGIRDQVIADMHDQGYQIIGSEHPFGLVVPVKFKGEIERLKIATYCTKHNLEYTICPREIRVMQEAMCIEVKRVSSE